MDASTLEKARALFPHITAGRIYLNHAATSPMSKRVVEAIDGYLRERSVGRIETYQSDLQMYASCREAIRRMIKAESVDRIALVGNTSDALNIVASGITWRAGDRILLNDLEFPANIHPYYHLRERGVEIDILKADRGRVTAEMIVRAIRPRTRLVALSAVQFLSGYRADLATIGERCRTSNVRLIVDGIQAVGAIQLDVQRMKIDALAAGGQKWQMSPQGTGFLYVTESLQNEMSQQYVGWLSVNDPWQFSNYDQPLAPTARRYEGGTLNVTGFVGMRVALETLLEFGTDKVERHILNLTGQLTEFVQDVGGLALHSPDVESERAGIVTVQSSDGRDLTPVFERLQQQHIDISLREGKLRFSPHFYNTADEVRSAVEAVRTCLR